METYWFLFSSPYPGIFLLLVQLMLSTDSMFSSPIRGFFFNTFTAKLWDPKTDSFRPLFRGFFFN